MFTTSPQPRRWTVVLFAVLLLSGLALPGWSQQEDANAADQGSGDAADEAGQAALAGAEEPEWVGLLYEGRLAEAERTLLDQLQNEKTDRAWFGLAVTRLLRSTERLMQAGYRFGFRPGEGLPMPMLGAQLPIPRNPDPQQVSAAMVRTQLTAWVDDLRAVERTLARIDGGFKLPLRFGKVRLDFNGDGDASEDEVFWRIYERLNRRAAVAVEQRGQEESDVAAAAADAAQRFVIVFDEADAAWLRGYCHLLMAGGEIALAHDWRRLFDRTAQLFFARPDTPFPFLVDQSDGQPRRFDPNRIMDLIAMVHLIDLPVREPQRMRSALEHLEQMVQQSRRSWELILAETDDQREWVPAPRQTGVLPGVDVTEEMVEQWRRFLDEAEALLAGEKLVPFWRPFGGQGGQEANGGNEEQERGVNLRRVFTEPRRFDLVLWVQGSAAGPYLEEGEVTDAETWRRFQRVFGGEFIGFAIWFN